MVENEVWECERRFWLDRDNFYDERVAPDALLVFLPIDARHAHTWTDLAFSRQRSNFAVSDTAVLAYEAHAEAASLAHTYHACCSSTYVRVRRAWMLVAHQRWALASLERQLTERSALSLFFGEAR